MSDNDKRNYHKESGYAAQAKYQATHYSKLIVKVPKVKKEALESLAAAQGVSVSKLVKDALLQTYGIDCFTQK